MKPIAYVQKFKGEFLNINFLTAYLGATKYGGYEGIAFEHEDEILPKLRREDFVYGGIPVMKNVYKHFGVNPIIDNWPAELEKFMGRKTWQETVIDVNNRVEAGESYFVKPLSTMNKTFTGTVMKKFVDLIRMNHLSADTIVQCSEPVEFVTEYRCFMHKKLGVLGCKHYSGNWRLMIDQTVPDECLKLYTNSPIAYSLDLGLTKDGRTLLVECNDAYALGCYGLDPSAYSVMIMDRWNEVVGNSS